MFKKENRGIKKMKVIKINAIWCSGCLIMNKTWKKVQETKNIETINLDYDMDEEEVKEYNPGDKLPILIFTKDDKEIKRLVGEHSYEELISVIEELENE